MTVGKRGEIILKTTWKQQQVQQAPVGGLGCESAIRGVLPTSEALLSEFASEAGFRPSFAKSGNPRVRKS